MKYHGLKESHPKGCPKNLWWSFTLFLPSILSLKNPPVSQQIFNQGDELPEHQREKFPLRQLFSIFSEDPEITEAACRHCRVLYKQRTQK